MPKLVCCLTIGLLISFILPIGQIDQQLSAAEKAPRKRPNILFILADDQSPWDLQVYNKQSVLDTPVLDQLAKDGMVFDGAYHMGAWAGGVCTPSRHMIMAVAAFGTFLTKVNIAGTHMLEIPN